MTSRISVLIPSYDSAPYLAESLDSILPQVSGRDEVVIVDDGSTDDTPAVLARYAGRVRVVRCRHGGLAAARNTALEHARGEWIAFHDADDLAVTDRLTVLRGVLEAHPDADGVFSNGVRLGAPDERVVRPPTATRLDGAVLRAVDVFLGFPVHFQSALVSRRAFARAGSFDESIPVQPDLEYGYRLFSAAHIRFIDRPTFSWRSHDGNMSRDHVGTREDVATILERVHEAGGEVAEQIGRRALTARLAGNWYRLARAYARRGERRRAARAARRATELRPFDPRYRLLSWQLA